MVAASESELIEVRSRAELRAWLTTNHEQDESVWLVTFKKPSAHYVAYGEIVDEALCFGWVDSQPRALDTERSMRRLSPRRRGSNWSKVNKDKIERLIAAGRMTKAGLALVEQAKQDGTWSALDKVDSITIPPDLAAALATSEVAWANFEGFPRSSKRLILEWIESAKKPTTRAQRVSETMTEARVNRRAHHARQPATSRSAS